ncbi:glycoside hydrolase family 15 protein [Rubrobacter naiadicus]|uniref:glycoside hydrolase family 15 protein n=1 Tax=Rubrobacter naiadicus TaxID=1392641 RepID=UPI0023607B6F|nr:glycoside hydrolase family 15 protein [Rubrobacter naiadicus]
MPDEGYPPIGDYALIADSNSAALVSRSGSMDWCCIQRVDAGSCFGRILDRKRGGFCSISPTGDEWDVSRRYLDETLVLETTFTTGGGEVRLYDFFAMPASEEEHRQIVRIVEGVRGHVELEIRVAPRFDYGEIDPWIRQEGARLFSAIGGNDGLLIHSDADVGISDTDEISAKVDVHAGDRVHLSILSVPPARLDRDLPEPPGAEELDRRLEETVEWWRGWASGMRFKGRYRPGVLRSAITIKALMNEMTGAVAAAATTSLPEIPGGSANWDYRYSWIRDSFFSVRSLAEVGFEEEADAFRRFIERSAAGNARKLQIMYGVGGERTLVERELGHLEGYRGARPVRVGNLAAGQMQLGVFGQLLELSWRWHKRGNSPDDDYWRFIVDLVNTAAERWSEPDAGIWEKRGNPEHFVYSKAGCWCALDRGIKLSEECMRRAPTTRWRKVREEIREAIESDGYDEERGVFVRAFGSKDLDGALLLLPETGFVDYDDERMVRTTDAIRRELDDDGLIRRFPGNPQEGAFLACSFWLAECLARQKRSDEAQEVFDRALATGNDLGLFSEEYDVESGELLGNFPQVLTHLAHISAAFAISEG